MCKYLSSFRKYLTFFRKGVSVVQSIAWIGLLLFCLEAGAAPMVKGATQLFPKDTLAPIGFSYRAIYSPTNLQPHYAEVAGTHNIENDWGIWGHNLNKVVGKKAPQEVYALVEGKRNQDQFCFSSATLSSIIEAFITENYGEKGHNLFMIAPNDNALVCQCPSCIKAGNSPKQATAAVGQLIVKLAKRFPMHSFFTLSYLTTKEVPKNVWPPNAGVLISAIDLPLTCNEEHSPSRADFIKTVDDWKAVTPNIYVWDYINNFDDYLTPFPCLSILKERFLFFKEKGVSGLFLNGSGYEYSSFDDLKTAVLSALMINPNLSVEALATDFIRANYPACQSLITPYYLSLEKRIYRNKKKLNLYGGITDAVNAYLDQTEFINFYNDLSQKLEQLQGEERKKVDKLLIALAYTRLEIARLNGYEANGCYVQQGAKISLAPSVTASMNLLSQTSDFEDMKSYNEAGSTVSSYLSDWKRMIVDRITPNLLRGERLVPLNRLIGEEMNVRMLTDGVRGLPSNYHFGWGITAQPKIEFKIPMQAMEKGKNIGQEKSNSKSSGQAMDNNKNIGEAMGESKASSLGQTISKNKSSWQAVSNSLYLEIGFLQQKRHRIWAPTRVEIWIDGKMTQVIKVERENNEDANSGKTDAESDKADPNSGYERWRAFAPLKYKLGQQILLRIIPATVPKAQTAIDEIFLTQ